MSQASQTVIGQLDWVLVLAPYRQDAAYVESLLTGHGLAVRRCDREEDLAGWLELAPGVILATHEALSPGVIEAIAGHASGQPAWSELSIVVLLDRRSRQGAIKGQLGAAWRRARAVFYQRPIATLELVSGVQAALLARLRQREVGEHIERETMLRMELNHRVKNILASVSSMFEMTRRGARSMEELVEEFTGRVEALGKVHAAVFQAGGESVSLAEIVELTVSPYHQDGRSRIRVKGPDLRVRREAGTTLALCLHELATNAIKYGALSGEQGTVTLNWEVSTGNEPTLILEWCEQNGPPVAEPSRAGYGTRYIHSSMSSLFGQPPSIVYQRSGLVFRAGGPVSRLTLGDATTPVSGAG